MGLGGSSKRSLRVALVSTRSREPASGAMVAELSRALSALGHRPTVFARGEAAAGAPSARPPGPEDRLAELRQASAAWSRIATIDDFDVVHVNDAESLPFTNFVPVPTLATVHHDRAPSLSAHYAAYPDVSFVAVSRRQAELAWEVRFRAVVHHGLRLDRFPLGKGSRRCVFLGSLAPESGPQRAIEAARRSRTPLVLAADAHRPQHEHFQRTIAPRLGPGITWGGAVDGARKTELVAGARALLAPAHWEEPSGLAMIESMLVGTPVIAYACGAAPEIVEDGVTGFLVHDVDEMCQRIRDVGAIDREACRARARSRWSSARMAREYATLYHEAIDRWSAARSRYAAPPAPFGPVPLASAVRSTSAVRSAIPPRAAPPGAAPPARPPKVSERSSTRESAASPPASERRRVRPST
ncbi:MAG: glycosyltransferase family 4 protein [Labilithrix sp.]|nr:glycosyltransferase family 4 protein [Labilithrix sp.]